MADLDEVSGVGSEMRHAGLHDRTRAEMVGDTAGDNGKTDAGSAKAMEKSAGPSLVLVRGLGLRVRVERVAEPKQRFGDGLRSADHGLE